MTTVILDREDFGNPLHPGMFDAICEQFDIDPRTTDSITLHVTKAEETPG